MDIYGVRIRKTLKTRADGKTRIYKIGDEFFDPKIPNALKNEARAGADTVEVIAPPVTPAPSLQPPADVDEPPEKPGAEEGSVEESEADGAAGAAEEEKTPDETTPTEGAKKVEDPEPKKSGKKLLVRK